MQNLIAKTSTLLEALPYIQKFSGATFVVKYGGSFMDSPDPAVRNGVARDIVFLEAVEIDPVVVHGGGKAITRAMEKAGLKAAFIQGQRVTDDAAVKIVDEVLSREINPEVVAAINAMGGAARGFAGPDIFKCRKLQVAGPDGQPLDIGYVGEVTQVNAGPLLECIQQGITPVISPTARGEDGHIYNCNADVAAAQVAIALKAKRLLLLTDVPGVLDKSKELIPELSVADARKLIADGTISGGMIPKIETCIYALDQGVEGVVIMDGKVSHAVLLELLTDHGVGTLMHR